MKVYELIERLKQFDPNGIVYLEDKEGIQVEAEDVNQIIYTHEGTGEIDVVITGLDEERCLHAN